MQIITKRICLLLFMGLIFLLTIGYPGLHDSIRYHKAYSAYRNAPNEQTQRALQDAKRLDHRNIMIFECIMFGILGLSVYSFIRAGDVVHPPTSD
jgi:hypothetical protein